MSRTPSYMQMPGPNKRWSNYEYQLPYMNEYIHTNQSRINEKDQAIARKPTFRQHRFNVDGSDDGKKQQRAEKNKKRNFKIYLNEKDESGGGSRETNIDVISSSDQDAEEAESEYDAFEEYNK